MNIDISKLPSPCYLVDKDLLVKNLDILRLVRQRTGCSILLAQKAFSMFSVYPLIADYLDGVTSSSLFEARLGFEEMKGEVHIYAPAYMDEEFDKVMEYCDHIVFNSFSQWSKFRDRVKAFNNGNCRPSEMDDADTADRNGTDGCSSHRARAAGGNWPDDFSGQAVGTVKRIECGIRINPEYSEIETDIYNPCRINSRFGVTLENFRPDELDGIDGLHFHTMCEQNSDTLERTVKIVNERFGKYVQGMKWINFGGGHHITREDYDIERLIRSIMLFKEKYGVQVYLEPGEAVALNTGYLVGTVLDIVKNNMDIAILDVSAACHMPDVLEMPYRPKIIGAGEPGEFGYTYRLGGNTCLAGDEIGDYSFKAPLKPGDRLVFCDMAHYTMVKNNTFNGINLPSIALYSDKEGIRVVRTFGYEDFRSRLS